MKRKGRESKLNIVLTATLICFVSLLCFSVGVITGKGWSDRERQVAFIERDSHVKAAMEDNEPLGDDMTQKEVELLTKRALEEAQAEAPDMKPLASDTKLREVASAGTNAAETSEAIDSEVSNSDDIHSENDKSSSASDETPKGREASMAAKMKTEMSEKGRKVSSLMPKPSMPKPASIEYTVQVASYKTMKEAERHSQKLIDKGFPAFPVKAMINGEVWHRVSIGTFKNRKRAIRYEKELKKQAVVKSTFVQKIKRLKK